MTQKLGTANIFKTELGLSFRLQHIPHKLLSSWTELPTVPQTHHKPHAFSYYWNILIVFLLLLTETDVFLKTQKNK